MLTLGLSQSETKESEAKPVLLKNAAAWKEPELASPIPRRVVLRRGYIRTAVLIAVLFLTLSYVFLFEAREGEWGLFAAVFIIFAVLVSHYERDRRLSRLLVSSGTATRGIIVEHTCIVGNKGHLHWQGVIAYETPARREIRLALHGKIKVGNTLTVLYMPETPEKAMLYKECHYKAVASQEEQSA